MLFLIMKWQLKHQQFMKRVTEYKHYQADLSHNVAKKGKSLIKNVLKIKIAATRNIQVLLIHSYTIVFFNITIRKAYFWALYLFVSPTNGPTLSMVK